MSNFTFLQADFPDVYAGALEAEALVYRLPWSAAVRMRSVLENAVSWLFEHDRKLDKPWRSDLSTLMHERTFSDMFTEPMLRELHLIRKTGNLAAHGQRVSGRDALLALKGLFRFLKFVAIHYGESEPVLVPFDEALIPQLDTEPVRSKTDAKKIKKLVDNLAHKNKLARIAEQELAEKARENAELKRQLEAQKDRVQELKIQREKSINLEQAIPLLVSEVDTRRHYIDVALREAGWDDLKAGRDLEFPVTGMPKSTNPSGKGYVDYVLWGEDGLPLAVVEAKKTLDSPKKGKHQAELYADCLEQAYGQRPIIFYSNGFETYLWDDQFAPERLVQGFYTQKELLRLIQRRDPKSGRQDLTTYQVNDDITNRAYQKEAIKRVAENTMGRGVHGDIMSGARRSLLVMATGSGKTRTSASLVDMFTKLNWAKRVLFLADRNALVTQAKNAFNELLPHVTAIDLTKEKEDASTRLVFSTYPTIMNRIDGFNSDQGASFRFYGVGHFDLIIIDEAHRSVYKKYKAIFDYFDAMLVGLTATPKADVDHNTYELFGIEDDDPTYAYELDKAVEQGFLVPPRAMSVPLNIIRQGIKYCDLSAEEKAQYEEVFGDPADGAAEEIDSSAINKWLFNADTVDQVLHHLMTKGIKVQGGEKVGKSIIFAKSHKHAEFIEERFNNNYPHLAGKFLRIIDNYESKAQSMLETFVDHYQDFEPQIAVSVDMMDTGVDAPRVVNLVFFKLVKSYTKFWQMIGRGTRLCPDLFGPGDDKTHFAVFDFCLNFEFFGENPKGLVYKAQKGLTQRIFEAKAEVAVLIRESGDDNPDQLALADEYIKLVHSMTADLDRKRFEVHAELRWVVEYSVAERWVQLSQSDLVDLGLHISRLILPNPDDDEYARRFDVLMLNYQLALLASLPSTDRFVNKVHGIAAALIKKKNTIPAVKLQSALLDTLTQSAFWDAVNVCRIEEVRLGLRDLLKYLDVEEQQIVYTTFKDDLDESNIKETDLLPGLTQLTTYKERVERYIRAHQDHAVIQKLKTNQPINQSDLHDLESMLFSEAGLGSQSEFESNYGEKPLGEFIRFIVGMDVQAAQAAFSTFIDAGHLSANQMQFVDAIISHLTTNGKIEASALFDAPFTSIHDQGIYGLFDDEAVAVLMGLMNQVNDNAEPRV